jgi:hypothetical protein
MSIDADTIVPGVPTPANGLKARMTYVKGVIG